MKIRFLGTGAADWNIDERVEGEFFRRLSSLLVGDDLLIDPGPHIFDFCQKEDRPALYDGVKNVLITHSHGDHFNADSLLALIKHGNVHVWCNEATAHKVRTLTENYTVMRIGEKYNVGAYEVTALFANHSVISMGELAMLFAISDGEKNLFYGCDSAWLPYETWKAMGQFSFDCAVLEVTIGDVPGDHRIFEHNNIEMARLMLETMRARNVLGSGGIAIGSHFSRYAHTDHETLKKRLGSFGMMASYDGLEVEF